MIASIMQSNKSGASAGGSSNGVPPGMNEMLAQLALQAHQKTQSGPPQESESGGDSDVAPVPAVANEVVE